MNLDEIKKRLDKLNNKGGGGSSDFKNNFWRPPVGEKSVIRIVPYKFNKDIPFSELYFYFGIGKPRMIALSNFDESDPILEFATQLKKSGDKDNMEMAKKLYPKFRVFAPVLVRGEEDKGVRLWQFGKMIYEDLLSMAIDDEIGDYTDIVNGRDFTLETVGPESTGTNYNKTSVRPRMKTSALSDDKAQVEKWLAEQPNPKEVFKRFTFDEMKDALVKWLSPEDAEAEGDIVSEPANDFDDLPWDKKEEGNFSLDTSKVKENKKDQFDSIFE